MGDSVKEAYSTDTPAWQRRLEETPSGYSETVAAMRARNVGRSGVPVMSAEELSHVNVDNSEVMNALNRFVPLSDGINLTPGQLSFLENSVAGPGVGSGSLSLVKNGKFKQNLFGVDQLKSNALRINQGLTQCKTVKECLDLSDIYLQQAKVFENASADVMKKGLTEAAEIYRISAIQTREGSKSAAHLADLMALPKDDDQAASSYSGSQLTSNSGYPMLDRNQYRDGLSGAAVAYISPAAIDPWSSPLIRDDPGTKSYLAREEYKQLKTLVAGLFGLAYGEVLSFAGASFSAANSVRTAQIDVGVARTAGVYNESVAVETVNGANGILFDEGIANHLTRFDRFSQKTGISGTHNLDEFMQAATQNNVKIVSQTPSATNGITQIKNQIPKIDAAKNMVVDASGSVVYKNQVFTKTVYDPSVISNETIVSLGKQAAANGYQSAISSGYQAFNADAGGIPFRVYIDPKTGTITNYHPR